MALVKRVEERPAEIREYSPCAFEPCNKNAEIRMRKGNANVNVCRSHYDRLFGAYAKKWCADRGLLTTAEKIAFCKRIAGSMGVKL